MGGVNLFLHSLFQPVNVSLSDVQVSQSSESMPIGRILNHSSATDPKRNSQLTASLFYKDTAGNMNRSNSAQANEDERNLGLQKRASFTDEGATVDLILDAFIRTSSSRNRFMLNEVNVKVRLVRNKDSFCLMYGEANASYKVRIVSVVLLVRKVPLSPSVFLAHAKALVSGWAKYLIRRVVCMTYTIPAGNLD